VATVKYRPPAGTWGSINSPGPTGETGETGPEGPVGVTGPHGLPDEVAVGPDTPTLTTAELWFDLDAIYTPGQSELPSGGVTGQLVVKGSDTSFDTGWDGLHLPLTGGTVTGDLAVDGDASVATLTSANVSGDVWFENDITANSVESRVDYAWEEWDVAANLFGNFHSDLTIGPCKAWRNAYMVLVNLCIGSNPEIAQEVWLDIATLPTGWRPAFEMWSTGPSVDVQSDSITTEHRIRADGMIQLRGKALNSPDPQITTRFSLYYCYPRSDF
jgi:hypothetical protein